MKQRRNRLSPEDHQRISAAIGAAEARTSGEIYCVLARTSDDYFYPAGFALAVSILLLGVPLAYGLHYFWFPTQPLLVAMAQLAAFAAGIGLLALFPSMRILLVPRRLRYRRAHDNARKQFLAHNIHATEGRTGVLIFVSLAERYVEVIADAGIDAEVEQEVWNRMVAGLLADAREGELANGFIAAVNEAGRILQEFFPARPSDSRNEIPDKLTEL